jgi:hypothetical protein
VGRDEIVTSRRGGGLSHMPAKGGGDFRWWMPAGRGLWKVESTKYTVIHIHVCVYIYGGIRRDSENFKNCVCLPIHVHFIF